MLGSDRGSVCRAVASDTRDPRFDSSHWQDFIMNIFTVNCCGETKIKRKEPGNGPLKNFLRAFHHCIAEEK